MTGHFCKSCGHALVPVGDLTPTMRRLMLIIQRHVEDHGVCATYEELAGEMGLASKSGIARLIGQLEERGYVRRRPHRWYAIAILRWVEPLETEKAA